MNPKFRLLSLVAFLTVTVHVADALPSSRIQKVAFENFTKSASPSKGAEVAESPSMQMLFNFISLKGMRVEYDPQTSTLLFKSAKGVIFQGLRFVLGVQGDSPEQVKERSRTVGEEIAAKLNTALTDQNYTRRYIRLVVTAELNPDSGDVSVETETIPQDFDAYQKDKVQATLSAATANKRFESEESYLGYLALVADGLLKFLESEKALLKEVDFDCDAYLEAIKKKAQQQPAPKAAPQPQEQAPKEEPAPKKKAPSSRGKSSPGLVV